MQKALVCPVGVTESIQQTVANRQSVGASLIRIGVRPNEQSYLVHSNEKVFFLAI